MMRIPVLSDPDRWFHYAVTPNAGELVFSALSAITYHGDRSLHLFAVPPSQPGEPPWLQIRSSHVSIMLSPAALRFGGDPARAHALNGDVEIKVPRGLFDRATKYRTAGSPPYELVFGFEYRDCGHAARGIVYEPWGSKMLSSVELVPTVPATDFPVIESIDQVEFVELGKFDRLLFLMGQREPGVDDLYCRRFSERFSRRGGEKFGGFKLRDGLVFVAFSPPEL